MSNATCGSMVGPSSISEPVCRSMSRMMNFVVAADGAGDVVTGAVHELGQAVHDDVGPELDRRDDQRRERVVDDQLRPVPMGDLGELRDVGHSQRRVGDRLAVQKLGARREWRARPPRDPRRPRTSS